MHVSSTLIQQEVEQSSVTLEAISYNLQKKYLQGGNLQIAPPATYKNEYTVHSLENKTKIGTSIRFLHLCKFVYEKDVKIAYKLRSVYTALHSINAGLILKLVSDGTTCRIYMGVKTVSKAQEKIQVLRGSLDGNFPGTKTTHEDPSITTDCLLQINKTCFEKCREVTAVVGIPSLKDQEEDRFIQGIENVILGMNGKSFSAVFIADPVSGKEVENALNAYETIYSILSSQKEYSETTGTNTSSTTSTSKTVGTSHSSTDGTTETTTKNSSPWIGRKFANSIFGTGSKNADNIASGLEKGIQVLTGSIEDYTKVHSGGLYRPNLSPDLKTKSEGNSTKGTNTSTTKSDSQSSSETNGKTDGNSLSRQITFTNKKVANFLEKLDQQIERLEQGKGIGFWNVGAYFMSDDVQNSAVAAHIYNGMIKGQDSNFETSVVKTFTVVETEEKEKIIEYLRHYEIPRLQNGSFLAHAVTTDELSVQINLPHKSVVGLEVVEIIPFGNNPQTTLEGSINVGKLYNYEKIMQNNILLDINKFTSHVFVTGSTGSGKSNVTYNIISELIKNKVKFLVIEPAKGEYKDEFGNRHDVAVYGTNPNHTELLKINPFQFPPEIHIYEHIDRFIEILNACWPMEAAMPNVLKEALEDAYISKGWILTQSKCIQKPAVFPDFHDLLKSLEKVVSDTKFSAEVKGNYEGALVTRVRSLTNGLNRLIFDKSNLLTDEQLFDENVIIDLSRAASSEFKALMMGIVFMKLHEYRMSTKSGNNSKLKHITVLEEAHNLLKRTSSEQTQNTANLTGKSVEMISNAIAEMRTYGEGFIIADQAPGLLDISVIRNTNTKICLRLPDYDDRELVGKAMSLTDDQITQLANLETGVAALYQNDWQEAILCKFKHFVSEEDNLKFRNKIKLKEIPLRYLIEKSLTSNKILNLRKEQIEEVFDLMEISEMLQYIQRLDKNMSSNLLLHHILNYLSCVTNLEKDEIKILLKKVVLPTLIGISQNPEKLLKIQKKIK